MKIIPLFVLTVFLLQGCLGFTELLDKETNLGFEPDNLLEEFAVDDIKNDETRLQGGSCQCQQSSCSCCKKIDIKKGIIHIKKTVCAKLVYKQSTVGVDLQVTIDGKVIAHKEINAGTPAPICGDIKLPGVGKEKACIKLENFHIDNKGVSGCIKATADGKISINVDIGCFKIPQSMSKIRTKIIIERELEVSK